MSDNVVYMIFMMILRKQYTKIILKFGKSICMISIKLEYMTLIIMFFKLKFLNFQIFTPSYIHSYFIAFISSLSFRVNSIRTHGSISRLNVTKNSIDNSFRPYTIQRFLIDFYTFRIALACKMRMKVIFFGFSIVVNNVFERHPMDKDVKPIEVGTFHPCNIIIRWESDFQ